MVSTIKEERSYLDTLQYYADGGHYYSDAAQAVIDALIELTDDHNQLITELKLVVLDWHADVECADEIRAVLDKFS